LIRTLADYHSFPYIEVVSHAKTHGNWRAPDASYTLKTRHFMHIDSQLISAIATLTKSLGTQGFGAQLKSFIDLITPIDSMAVLLFPKQGRPSLLSELNLPGVINKGATIEQYLSGAYLLDPYFQACKDDKPTGFCQLKDIVADDFYQSEYFRQYYQYANFCDEAGYITTHNDGHLHLSLAQTKAFSSNQLEQLEALTPLILALIAKQWQPQTDKHNDTIHARLNMAFEYFGKSLLTEREGEVARLLLHGHSSKSMAHKLDISTETIKVHKRNLYVKLDIGTQAELFSLFLGALQAPMNDSKQDPLIAYLGRQ